jgi:TolA-binding protein
MSNEMDAARARVGELERRLSEVNGEVLRLEGLLKNHLRLQAERDEAVVRLAELEGLEPVAWVQPWRNASQPYRADARLHRAWNSDRALVYRAAL